MSESSPEQHAGLWSQIFFGWVSPTLRLGAGVPLSEAGLLPLPSEDDAAQGHSAFTRELDRLSGKRRPVMRAVWTLHRRSLASVVALSIVFLAATVGSPLILRELLRTLTDSAVRPLGPLSTWWLAALMFGTTLATSLSVHHIFHRLLRLSLRVRNSLTTAIYRKALKLTLHARQTTSTGQIINLMGADTQKFVQAVGFIHSLWVHPLQILIILGILVHILGSAALVGAALLVVFMLASSQVARRMIAIRKSLSGRTDARVNLMSEILGAIKVIKFYAWEASFAREVSETRRLEVRDLSRLAKYGAIGALIFLSAPVAVAVATIGTFVARGNPLTATDVFPALALFAVLRHAMIIFPEMVTVWLEANVAVGRIETFLQLAELPPRSAGAGLAPGTVSIRNATFDWIPGQPALTGINLDVRPGELVCVVGGVGGGKSALLSIVAAELPCVAGVAEAAGSIAYVPQQAWIMNDTVRDNILFGEPFEHARYERALDASCLRADLHQLPAGDATEIGERGINLSGGQKQRLAIARALYRDADIYLLDDPLSALDNEVGRQVMERAVLSELQGVTRILATHRLEYTEAADRILVVEDGRIVEAGTPAALKNLAGSRFSALWRDYEVGGAAAAKAVTATTGAPTAKAEPAGPVPTSDGRLVTDEERRTGRVTSDVYLLYLKTFAPGLIALGLLAAFVSRETLVAGTDAWLAWWSARDPLQVGRFLAGYAVLGFLACLATFVRSLSVSLRGLVTGARFHGRVLDRVLRAPMGFFESTPTGRILNRFSRDVEAVDQQIPRSIHESAGCVFNIVTMLVVVTGVWPMAFFAIIPITWAYWRIQNLFRPTARECQRLESVTRSPIYAQFSESLSGLSVIRAFDGGARFEAELVRVVTVNARAFYTMVSANRWLGVRIETLGAAIVATAAFAAAWTAGTGGIGFPALAITYALGITGAMNWAVRMFSQLESNLNSVERLEHYSRMETESAVGMTPSPGWPDRGGIIIEGLELRYRPELAPAIRNLSAVIAPGERIGIVGRTGAGKSSLILGLFRLIEPAAGRILIDGTDIADLTLPGLRAGLAVIPQDPTLFRGTIRKNLDPFGAHADPALWRALECAHLAARVRAMPLGLETEVHESGSNFSVGQRQLLCLARAVLRGSKVLILDEATASVDVTTDNLIKRTIRESFASATVLTIAHRLGTVMDADRVMVISHGQLVEFDQPGVLAGRSQGYFAALLRESSQTSG